MSQPIPRRDFIKRALLAGAGVVGAPLLHQKLHAHLLPDAAAPAPFELCSIVGDGYFENTMKAIDALGGMQRFVKKGNTVALLINATFDGRAASTNPDIPLAVMKMCQDAGAREIWLLKQTGSAYWRRSSQYPRLKADVDTMRYEDEFKEVKIDQGKSLKSAEVAARLLSCDVFINLPIIKDHEGTRFTGNLKNMMGACSSSTCRRFHFGDSSVLNVFKGYYSNPELLAQSIADVNLIRRPNLCVVDATEILATNGPAGPGEVRKPREVIVSTSCVAADMYASRHLGLDWQELLVIRDAIDHGYGPKSLKEVSIRTL